MQRVSSPIIEAAKHSKYAESAKQFQWDVAVIKDVKTKNAFALPGGKIAVYTGIFPVAENEAGLAAIIGHEVIHALARHGFERMSQGVLAQVGLVGASIAMQTQGFSPMTSQAAMSALGVAAKVGVLLPCSRAHESEADYIGLLSLPKPVMVLRKRSGFGDACNVHPGGQQPQEFLSTHPGHETRIKRLKEKMPEALTLYQQANKAPVAQLPALGIHSDSPLPSPP